jgi:acetyl-CoA carboxylase biotin carboxyl carrier protein
VDLDEIIKLMNAMEERQMTRLAFKDGGVELELERGQVVQSEGIFPQAASAGNFLAGAPMGISMLQGNSPVGNLPPVEAAAEAPTGRFITSPVVGTFYHAAAPGEPIFVKVGDRVEPDKVVAIVEAMKVMNEVKAGESGVIAEVLVEDGQPVEFGTKIFRIV